MDEFITRHIHPIIYAQGLKVLAEHKAKGHKLILLSATGEHLVHPIAKALGMDVVMAINLETINGVYTGKTRGVMTFREGKVTRLQSWLERRQIDLTGSWFYSDSMNDVALLEKVDNPVVTNGDQVLSALAEEKAWLQLNF